MYYSNVYWNPKFEEVFNGFRKQIAKVLPSLFRYLPFHCSQWNRIKQIINNKVEIQKIILETQQNFCYIVLEHHISVFFLLQLEMEELLTVFSPGEAPVLSAWLVCGVTVIDLSDRNRAPGATGYPASQ